MGRLNFQKGLDVLLEALSEIKEDLPDDFRLMIVGDGPEEKKLRKKLKD